MRGACRNEEKKHLLEKNLADIEDSKEASLAAWKIPAKTNVWKMSSQNKIIMHKR